MVQSVTIPQEPDEVRFACSMDFVSLGASLHFS
jgi:hypothetical protein